MISLKSGVLIVGLKSEILVGLLIIKDVFDKYKVDLVITEATGGHHMFESFHYKGLALDIRSKNISVTALKHTILFECQNALGENFDMILESEGQASEHFHAEFQPK